MNSRFNNPGPAMKHTTTQNLYAYWNAMRGARLAPRRFEIEPAQIADILPDTFILERVDFETYRFRLAGTRICEHFGAELRGSNFLDPWTDQDHLSLSRLLTNVTQQGAVGVLTIEAETERGQTVPFEVLVLPLVHTRDSIDRILGCISPLDLPDWLGHERLDIRRLVHSDFMWPEGRPHKVIEQINRQSPFHAHIRNARIVRSERRQFRVYEGGLSKAGLGEP